ADVNRPSLVDLMRGGDDPDRASSERSARDMANAPVAVRAERPGRGLPFVARRGEVIGLAGLAGHGQTEFLVNVYDAARKSRSEISVDGEVCFVAGDRQSDGVFPLLSIADNIAVNPLRVLRNRGLLA